MERRLEIDIDISVEEILKRLDLFKNGKLINATTLMFGKNPQKFFPQAEIRCAKFKGTKVTEPFIDMQVIGKTVYEQIDEAEKFALSHIKKAAWIVPEQIERVEKWEYPPDAMREAITNAICHRDYFSSGNVQIRIFDDRMEVWNPGGLPEDMTVEKLKTIHTSKPRNKMLAKSLFLIKYIEQWGTGTNRIIAQCLNEGLPEPEFIDMRTDFLIIFRKSKVNELLENPDLLNERQWRIIEYLKYHEKITSNEYKEIFKCSGRTSRMDLNHMVKLMVLKKIGKGKKIRYILQDYFRQVPASSGK